MNLEYLLMESIDFPKHQRITFTLDIKDAKLFTIKGKSLDGTDLVLYEWQKSFNVYNDRSCFLRYSFIDPIYGDKKVYVSKRPNDKVDVDVFFKYDGVPSKIMPEEKSASSSQSDITARPPFLL